MLVDKEIAAEFNELVKFGCAACSPNVELFNAVIRRKIFPAHVHDGFVIGIIRHGVESFVYRGSQYRAGPGDLILLNPDKLHTAQAGSPAGVGYCTIQIPSDVMANYVDPAFYFDEPVLHAPNTAMRLLQHFSMLEATQDPFTAQEELDTFLTEALASIRPEMFAKSSRVPIVDRRMQAIANQIELSLLTSRISVTELAYAVGISRFHFLRIFKKHFGVAPHAYIQARRVAKAKQLIASGLSPIQAAMNTGFVDQSHLTRWMKACYGVTPGTYRALYGLPQ